MEFSAEHLDLAKEVQPLDHFLDDRERLLEEVFSSVQRDRLQTLIPSCLKGLSLDELKRRCLEQLILLPRENIRHIFNGSEIEAEKPAEDDTADELIIDNGDDVLDDETIDSFEAPITASAPQMEEIIEDAGSSEWLSTFTKTQMEIVELEMRARAIRSLMKAQGLNISDDTSDHS